MAGRKKRSPDAVLKSKTQHGDLQIIRIYVFERYAIIYKVMLSHSDSFVPFAQKWRKFVFGGKKLYYYKMVLIVSKMEFLMLKKTLISMDPLTGLSQTWFDLENPNKSDKSLNDQG